MASSFDIGGVAIAGQVLVAPMTGVTDLPFRNTLACQGAAYVATEMVACAELARGRPDVVRRAAIGDGLKPMVVQLVGREADELEPAQPFGQRRGEIGRRGLVAGLGLLVVLSRKLSPGAGATVPAAEGEVEDDAEALARLRAEVAADEGAL